MFLKGELCIAVHWALLKRKSSFLAFFNGDYELQGI